MFIAAEVIPDSTGITWMQFVLGQTIAIIIGGIIPIALIIFKERRDSKKKMVEWFETEYIEKCVSELFEFFQSQFLAVSQPAIGVEVLAKCDIPVLRTSMARLYTITGGSAFDNWLKAIRVLRIKAINFMDLNLKVQYETQLGNMALRLEDLRKGLTEFPIKAKKQIYALRNLPCITTFNEAVHDMEEAIHQRSVADGTGTSYKAKVSEEPH